MTKVIVVVKSSLAVVIKWGLLAGLITKQEIACNIDVNKKISQKAREEILKNISKSFENIPENWLIEGEYKNDNFYVLYIRNDKKEILDVDETIEWAKIFEFCSPPVKNKLCINGIEKFKNMEIRPRNKFDKLEMIKQFGNNGKEKNINWRLKVKETFYEK